MSRRLPVLACVLIASSHGARLQALDPRVEAALSELGLTPDRAAGTLVRSGARYGYASPTGEFSVELGDDRAVRVARRDVAGALALRPVGGPLVTEAAIARGTQLLYATAGRDGVVSLAAGPTGVQEDIVLTEPVGDALELAWALDLPRAFSARLSGKGDVEVVDDERGRIAWVLPAPIVRQAGGAVAMGAARFELDPGQVRLVGHGLAALRYPLTIDPSVVVNTGAAFGTGTPEANTTVDVANNLVRRTHVVDGVGTWATTTPLPAANNQHSAVAYNGHAYVLGGNTPSATNQVLTATFGATGTVGPWVSTSPFATPRSLAAVVAASKHLYLLGGFTGASVPTADVQYAAVAADGSVGAWAAATPFPTARNSVAAAVFGNRVYAAGGYNGTTQLASVLVADILADGSLSAWTAVTALPGGVSGACAVAANGSLVLIGGVGAGATTASIAAPINPDGTLGPWTASPRPFPAGFSFNVGACGVWGGSVYAFGSSGTGVATATLLPGGATGPWSLTTDLPSSVTASAGFLAGGAAFLLGGISSGVAVTTVASAPLTQGQTRAWTAGPNFPTGFTPNYALATVYNNTLFEAGGLNGTVNSSAIYSNTIPPNGTPEGAPAPTWTTSTQTLTDPVRGGVMVAYADSLYVIGGYSSTSGGNVGTVTRYAIASNGTLSAPVAMTPMMHARSNAAGGVYNGRVYVAGGFDELGGFRNDVEVAAINNLANPGAWTVLPSTFTTGRISHGAAIWGGNLYILGGQSTTAGLYDVQFAPIASADGSLGAWTATTSISAGSYGNTAFAADGYLYDLGGYPPGVGGTDVRRAQIKADGTLGAWAADTPFLGGRYGAVGLTFDGNAYLVGGSNNPAVEFASLGAEGTVNPWSTSATTLPAGRFAEGAAVTATTLYVLGGTTGTGALGDVLYAPLGADGTVGAFTATTPFLTTGGRRYIGAFVNNNFIYIVGGDDGTTTFNEVRYAPLNADHSVGAWALATPFPGGARTGPGVTTGNGCVFVAGGAGGATGDVLSAPLNADGTVGAWIINPNTFTTNRFNTNAFTAGGYLYVLGGSATATFGDVQFAPINPNCSVGTFSFTAGSPMPRYQAVTFAKDGYAYWVGGFEIAYNQAAIVESAPILSNGRLGAWQTLQPLTTGVAYAAGGAGPNGFIYVVGGASSTGASNLVQTTQLRAPPARGEYSTVVDLGGLASSLDSIVVSGSPALRGQVRLDYRVAPASGVFGPTLVSKGVVPLGGTVALGDLSVRYAYVRLTLDDTASAVANADANLERDVTAVTLNFTAPLQLTPSSATRPPRGSVTFSAWGGSMTGYSWSMLVAPSGGTVNALTGAYTAGATPSVTDVVQVADSLGATKTATVAIGPGVSLAPASGAVYPKGGLSFSATGGSDAGFSWSLATNASGGSINAATGAYLAGATGSVTDVVKAVDSLGNSALASVGVDAGVTVTPAGATTPPKGSLTFAGHGGSGAGYAFALSPNASGGTVGPGTGAYTAGATGNVTDSVVVTDSAGNVGSIAVGVGAPVSLAASPAGVPPKGISTVTPAGGSGTGFVFSMASTPSGGTVDNTGKFTAGTTGSVTDVVAVVDSLGNTAQVSIPVSAAVSIAPASASTTPRGTATFTAKGGSDAGFTWDMQAAPSGGSVVAGTGAYTAGAVGSVNDVVRVTDSLGNVKTATVAVGPAVSLTPASATISPKGSIAFSATGGAGSYTWSMPSAPSGGSVNALTGQYTAGAVGGTSDVVRATDGLGNTKDATITVTAGVSIAPAIAAAPPKGTLSFSATGGSGTGYTWSLVLSPSGGSIIGATGGYTAGATGSVTDRVQVTDSLGNTATRDVAVGPGITINGPVSMAPLGTNTYTATGGSGSGYSWTMVQALSGGSINAATGQYTAGSLGNKVDRIQVQDSLGNQQTLSISVGSTVAISPASATSAPRGSVTFTASGGSGTGFAWSMQNSNSGGTVAASTGVYTAGPVGNVVDTVRVADSLGNSTFANVSVGPGVSVAPGSAVVAPLGSATFTASGGTGAGFTWTVATNLSGGTVSPAGVYTAGPTGNVTDVVKVTDSAGNTATGIVTVGMPLALAPALPSTPPRGSIPFGASGGAAPYRFSLALNPSGATVTALGGLYRAGADGGVVDVVEVHDANDAGVTTQVTVTPGVTVAASASTTPPRGTVTLTASGGANSGFNWSMRANLSGGSVGPSTGVYVAGTTGSVLDVVQATDALGNTNTFGITVGPAVTVSPTTPQVPPRGAVAFSATGGSGLGYSWAIAPNQSGGSIAPGTGAYVAGSAVGVDTVTATDSLGNVASTTVTVTNALSLTPSTAAVAPRATVAFVARGGGDGGYTFRVSTNNSDASISDAGVYTAGTTGGVTDVVTVTDNLAATASATVTVGPGVQLSPASANLAPKDAKAFSCSGGSGGGYHYLIVSNASGGTLDFDTGAYKAGGTGSVTDELKCFDPLGNESRATVNVTAGVSIDPPSANVPSGASVTFKASGGSGSGWAWSMKQSNSGGTISATGLYLAGATAGQTDVVQVTDSLQNSATATVTVGAGGACAQVQCLAMDACHVAGVCDPQTGQCTNPNRTNGETCPAGTCQDGVCVSPNTGAKGPLNGWSCGCGALPGSGAELAGLAAAVALLVSRRRRLPAERPTDRSR